jgi:hypothetical protein
MAARSAELLPVPYFHVVFTLPHSLSALVLQNKRLLYDLLYRTSAATMLELARDPKHLGADIGFLGVLHTWGQNLEHHPHVHYIVPAGGLALDGSRWIDSSRRFFLPVHALSRLFRGKFVAGFEELFAQSELQFHGSQQQLAARLTLSQFLRELIPARTGWSTPSRLSAGAEHVLNYLARYSHRVAISNHRLVAFENDRVSFRWRDYAHGGKKKVMTVSAHEFLRRFCFTSCPAAWFASATSGCSPTADDVLRSNAAALYSAWRSAPTRRSHTACDAQPAPASCWSSSGSPTASCISGQA